MVKHKSLIIHGILALLIIATIVTYIILNTIQRKKEKEEEQRDNENRAMKELMCRRAVDMYTISNGFDCTKGHEVQYLNDTTHMCIVYSNKSEQPALSNVRSSEPDRIRILDALKENEDLILSGKATTYISTISRGKCKKEENPGGPVSEGTVQVKLTPSAPVYEIVEHISDELCLKTSKDFQGYRNIRLIQQPLIPLSEYEDATCNQYLDSDGWKYIGYLESVKNYTVDLKTGHFTKLINNLHNHVDVPTIVCGKPAVC